MKVAVTSDWHGYIPPEIPDCDLLLVAGDAGLGEKFSHEPEVLLTDWMKFLTGLKMPVIAVAGNHDFENQVKIMKFLPWQYIEDEMVEIEGLKIWGSPWSNPFGYGWAFNMEEEDQVELFKQIPDDVDIIISHGPPKGLRDTVSYFDGLAWTNKSVGSDALRQRMEQLEDLKLVACGHIHPQYGLQKKWGHTVINGSLCNSGYKPVNKPIVIEL